MFVSNVVKCVRIRPCNTALSVGLDGLEWGGKYLERGGKYLERGKSFTMVSSCCKFMSMGLEYLREVLGVL